MMSEIQNIPKHWELKKLEDVCDEIFAGGDVPKNNLSLTYSDKYQIPIYANGEKNKGLYGYTDIPKVNTSSVTISARGTIGFAEVRNKPFFPIVRLIVLKPKEYLNSFYLKYAVDNCNIKHTGSSIPQLTVPTVRTLSIPLPPLPEQRAIVAKIEELFSDLENGKQQLLTAQEQLKVYRQSLLKAAFEGRLTKRLNCDEDDLNDEHDSKKKPGLQNHDNQANHINHSSDNLPKGWKVESLKGICEINRGKSKHRPRNDPSLYGGKYPFIQTGDIRNANGGYISTYSQTYSEKGLQQSKLWPKGTLCITIAANIGETAILKFEACFPDSVVGLVCNESIILIKYLNYFFISHKSKLEELAPATAQKNINVDILEKVSVPYPLLEEQLLIVSLLESRLTICDHLSQTIARSLSQAETLRQSILKKAFEGKLTRLNGDSCDLSDEDDVKKKPGNKNQGNHIDHKNHSSDNVVMEKE
jgi:type I restriction enzyme S subunit